jgi:hypothetical protein
MVRRNRIWWKRVSIPFSPSTFTECVPSLGSKGKITIASLCGFRAQWGSKQVNKWKPNNGLREITGAQTMLWCSEKGPTQLSKSRTASLTGSVWERNTAGATRTLFLWEGLTRQQYGKGQVKRTERQKEIWPLVSLRLRDDVELKQRWWIWQDGDKFGR